MRIIGGEFKNKPLKAPKGLNTRPTQSALREALFNICQHCIHDTSFLDLFAGSGAMGLEAISRGALRATFVDNDNHAIRCINDNVKAVGINNQTNVIRNDAVKAIEQFDKGSLKFDIIYIDPPYNIVEDLAVLEKIDNSDILADNGYVFLESRHNKNDIPQQVGRLKLISARKYGKSKLVQYQL